MGKFNSIQNNFTSGEVSPRAVGRTDLREYQNALEKLENFLVQPQGGAIKRPGFKFFKDLFDIGDEIVFIGGNNYRLFPFIFSNTESYIIMMSDDPSDGAAPFRIVSNDGVVETFNNDLMINVNSFRDYDINNWKYAQAGDVLVLTYAAEKDDQARIKNQQWESNVDSSHSVPPIFIIREARQFKAVPIMHPDFINELPEPLRFNPTIMRPYRVPNKNPDRRFYIASGGLTAGSTSVLRCVDSSGAQVPAVFDEGMIFTRDTDSPTQMGTFWKITRASTTGVVYGTSWVSPQDIPSAQISTPSETVTLNSGIGLITGDLVQIETVGGAGTDPVIADFDPVNGVYGQFYVRNTAGLVYKLYITQEDALADTNVVNITNAGTKGFRVIFLRMSDITVKVEVDLDVGLSSVGNASDNWQESQWSTSRGFPRAVTFYEQRLVMGGSQKDPDKVWFSQIGNIVNFMALKLVQDTTQPTDGYPETDDSSTSLVTDTGRSFVLFGDSLDTDPTELDISSRAANQIQWLEGTTVLEIGTLGAEYIASGVDGAAISALVPIPVKKQTEYGSIVHQPSVVNNSVVFITRDGRKARDFKFNRENGSYISANLNVISDHMVYKGNTGESSSSGSVKDITFKQIVFQPIREILWMLNSLGELVSVTFSRDTGTVAWSYHPIRSGDIVHSIAVVPNKAGDYSDLYALVQRQIDGGDAFYLEKMGDDFDHGFLNNTSSSDNDVPYYSDSSIKITLGSTTDTVTGLDHLEGETVNALAGNAIEKGLTVSSGQIVLSQTYASGTNIIVGLPYTATIRSLDVEAGVDSGESTAQGQIQRIDRLDARLYKSQGGSYGRPNETPEDIEYDDNEIFTGVKRLHFQGTPDTEAQIEITHDDPTPFNVLALTYRGVSYD